MRPLAVVLVALLLSTGLGAVPATAEIQPAAPVPIVGVWWTWVAPVTPVPNATAVLWIADTKHTVTTADSLEDALAGIANDRHNEDDDPDTFNVDLSGAPLSETFLYEHTFAEPGEKFYFCRFHHMVGMVGVVSVIE